MMRCGIALLALTVLAGCATARGPATGGRSWDDRPPGPPDAHVKWTSCDAEVGDPPATAGNDALAMPLLTDSFGAVSAIVCGWQPEQRPDGGEDLVATESRADDIGALLAALRLPDQLSTGRRCTLDLPVVPWFVLVDETGRWMRPGVPRDACGKPRIEVREAAAGLDLTRVSTRKIREITSAEAARSGCGQQWADMVWVVTTAGRSVRRDKLGVVPLPTGVPVRLCLYRVPDEEKRSGKPAGTLERGFTLPSRQWPGVERALLAAPAAGDCAEPAGRFALLRAVDDTGGTIYVELDGCKRIMVEPFNGTPMLGQADNTLIHLLTG